MKQQFKLFFEARRPTPIFNQHVTVIFKNKVVIDSDQGFKTTFQDGLQYLTPTTQEYFPRFMELTGATFNDFYAVRKNEDTIAFYIMGEMNGKKIMVSRAETKIPGAMSMTNLYIEGEKKQYLAKYEKVDVTPDGIIHSKRVDGEEYWRKDGEYHREDGPAIVFNNGRKFWSIHGNTVATSEEEFEVYKAKQVTDLF